MGDVSYFYAETKTFKLSIEERYLGLRGEDSVGYPDSGSGKELPGVVVGFSGGDVKPG
jgi:hypothetical protein